MDTELLNAVVIVLALIVIAGLPALLLVRHFSLRRSVSIKHLGALSEAEKHRLKTWARRTKVAFAVEKNPRRPSAHLKAPAAGCAPYARGSGAICWQLASQRHV
jgi:hypothetical protein